MRIYAGTSSQDSQMLRNRLKVRGGGIRTKLSLVAYAYDPSPGVGVGG